MGLASDEQEILISKIRNEKEFEIYISDRTYKTKIEKVSIKPYKVDIDSEGEEIAWYYKLPKNQIGFRKPPVKRELTDEQRLELAERIKNARESSKK